MAFKQFITLLKNIWDLFCTLLLSSAHIPDKKLKNKHIFHSQSASDGSSNILLKGTIQTFIFKCHYLEILVSDKKCNISVTHYFGFKNPFCLYDIILNWHKGIVACIPPHAKEWQWYSDHQWRLLKTEGLNSEILTGFTPSEKWSHHHGSMVWFCMKSICALSYQLQGHIKHPTREGENTLRKKCFE